MFDNKISKTNSLLEEKQSNSYHPHYLQEAPVFFWTIL